MKPGLRCPHCKNIDCSKVVETIKVEDGIRRRNRCKVCNEIFPSYEYVGVKQIIVDKRDGRTELFKREKVRGGVALASTKLGIDGAYIDKLTDSACERVHGTGKREISSEEIGRIVLEELLNDPHEACRVAYIRFASVFLYIRQPTALIELVSKTTEKLHSEEHPAVADKS